jgi:hypothetical protein
MITSGFNYSPPLDWLDSKEVSFSNIYHKFKYLAPAHMFSCVQCYRFSETKRPKVSGKCQMMEGTDVIYVRTGQYIKLPVILMMMDPRLETKFLSKVK